MGLLTKVCKGFVPKNSNARSIGDDGGCSEPYSSVGTQDYWTNFEKEELEYAIALSLSEEDDQKRKNVIEYDESKSEDDDKLAKIEFEDNQQLSKAVQVLEEDDGILSKAPQENLNMDLPPPRKSDLSVNPREQEGSESEDTYFDLPESQTVAWQQDEESEEEEEENGTTLTKASTSKATISHIAINQISNQVSICNEQQEPDDPLTKNLVVIDDTIPPTTMPYSTTCQAALSPHLRMALHAMENSVPITVDKRLRSLPPLDLASLVSADLCQALTGVLVNQQFVSARNEVDQLQSKMLELEEKLKCAEASASVTVDELMKRQDEAVKAARDEAVDNAIAAFKTSQEYKDILEAQELLGCLNLQAEVKTRYPNLDWSWMNKASKPGRKE